jgi:hypothetical protein
MTVPLTGYMDIGTIDVSWNNSSSGKNAKDFYDAVQPFVCKAGGNAAVAYANGLGEYIKASVLLAVPNKDVKPQAPSTATTATATTATATATTTATATATTATSGCQYDTQCKGDRICVDSKCVDSASSTPKAPVSAHTDGH